MMKKSRWLLLVLAVLGLLCANLRVQYRVTVAGASLPGRYSPSVLREGQRAAEAAADEILRYDAKMPETHLRLGFGFRRPENDVKALTAALLDAVSGVARADAVTVNGIRLGTVPDGERFCRALRDSILNQMPTAAVSGNISGQLSLRRVYTRADGHTNDEDMVLLVTGMAPVIYLDGSGKLA